MAGSAVVGVDDAGPVRPPPQGASTLESLLVARGRHVFSAPIPPIVLSRPQVVPETKRSELRPRRAAAVKLAPEEGAAAATQHRRRASYGR